MNPFQLVAVGFVAVIASILFFGAQPSESTEGTIRIGVVYALTGGAAPWSEVGKNALDMAVEEINNSGGVNGKRLEVVYEDSQTNPTMAVSAFNKLVNVDKVDVVVGDVFAFLTNPLIPLADEKKIVLISPTVMSESVEVTSPYYFTVSEPVESQRAALDTFLRTNSDVQSISILCWSDQWGRAHQALFRSVAEAHGVTVLSDECTGDFSNDYRSEMSKIKAVNSDAIFMSSDIPFNALKAYTELGLTQKVVSVNIVLDALENQKMPLAYAKNVWFIDWAANDSFVAKYKAKYGSYPILQAHNHYEIPFAIARAYAANKDTLRDGIKTVTYDGVAGTLDFTGPDNTLVNTTDAALYRVTPTGEYATIN